MWEIAGFIEFSNHAGFGKINTTILN